MSKVKSPSPYSGRAVAVIPDLNSTPKGYDGLNLTVANNLRADLQRQRDLVVIPEAATKEAETKFPAGNWPTVGASRPWAMLWGSRG